MINIIHVLLPILGCIFVASNVFNKDNSCYLCIIAF